MDLASFFAHLWRDYTAIAPSARRIHDDVLAVEPRIVNDHVAFRTYDLAPINLEALEPHLLALGYARYAPYEFKDKKLRAYGYVHESDPLASRVFLSELETRKLSTGAQERIARLVAQVDAARIADPAVMWAGRLWALPDVADYEYLAAESEYAGWVSIWGLRANHFTISVNHLSRMTSLEALLDFLESKGYPMNTAGGRIKGSPDVLLEQGSTLADEVAVTFAGGAVRQVPSCYYEFARRYPDPATGRIYDGFVAASADRIFESTNRRA